MERRPTEQVHRQLRLTQATPEEMSATGYMIETDSGSRIPASYYEVELWMMYLDAIEKASQPVLMLKEMEKDLNTYSAVHQRQAWAQEVREFLRD